MTTKIEWCQETYNPITGCTPISPGCAHCYAKRMATRLRGRYGYPADDPFRVTIHMDRFNPNHNRHPFRIKNQSMVFVCSMGDLFHKDVPESDICRVFTTAISDTPHRFLFLTKRPDRMAEIVLKYRAFQNNPRIWLGVTVENADYLWRVERLLQIPAAVRFVSVEPMLSEIDLTKYLNRGKLQENKTKGACHEGERDGVYVSGCNGCVLNRPLRENLATQADVWEPEREQICCSFNTNSKGGAVGIAAPPKGDVHAQRKENGDLCSSGGLDVPQPSRDSGGDGGQPQGRESEKQRSKQLGNRDETGKHPTCWQGAKGAREKGAIRREKYQRQAETGRCSFNQGHVGQPPNDSRSDGKALRCVSDHDKRDMPAKDLEAPSLSWVICGGESGPGARPMHPDWARSLRDQCVAAGVPYFFKQWGEWAPCPVPAGDEPDMVTDSVFKRGAGHDGAVWRVGKKAAGRTLDGREWNEVPN
jgi:protein gp37